MAHYDKSANRLVSFGLSVAIHVVILALLAGAQLFSNDGESEASADEPRKDEASTVEPAKADAPGEPEAPVAKVDEMPDASPPTSVAKPRPESVKKPAPPKAKPEKSPREKPAAAETVKTEIYVVKKGESLSSIARSRGCSFSELKRLNRAMFKKRSGLYVGDKIRVPLKSDE